MVKKVKVRTEKSKKEEEGIGPYGEIFFSWDFPEFEKRERSFLQSVRPKKAKMGKISKGALYHLPEPMVGW